MTYDVHTGRPSWHQQRAGHIAAAVTSGFETKEAAEEYARNYKRLHPDEPAFVLPAPQPKPAASKKKRSRFSR